MHVQNTSVIFPLYKIALLILHMGYLFMAVPAKRSGCSSKAKLLLLTLDEGYLLTSALPDLQHGIAPLGPPVPTSAYVIYTNSIR